MVWEEVILRVGGVEMERVGIICVRGFGFEVKVREKYCGI